jgi:hypothetical protein
MVNPSLFFFFLMIFGYFCFDCEFLLSKVCDFRQFKELKSPFSSMFEVFEVVYIYVHACMSVFMERSL